MTVGSHGDDHSVKSVDRAEADASGLERNVAVGGKLPPSCLILCSIILGKANAKVLISPSDFNFNLASREGETWGDSVHGSWFS